MARIYLDGAHVFHVEGSRQETLEKLKNSVTSAATALPGKSVTFKRMVKNPSNFASDPPVPGRNIDIFPSRVVAVEEY